MKRLEIVRGLIDHPIGEEVICGGCVIQSDSEGRAIRYGYVCSLRRTEVEKDSKKDISFRYILEDGCPVPL